MAFTFAHPAVVLPLIKILGRRGVLSALVIGSMSPDLAYLVPVHVARNESHSILGLFLFCVPLGLVTYIVFHKLLKGPFLSLMPEFLLGRLGGIVSDFKMLPSTDWLAILGCLFLGAVTHLIWDSFTHGDALGVMMIPMLKAAAFHVGARPYPMYKLLQHISAILGLTVMACYAFIWFQGAGENRVSLPFELSKANKKLTLGAIVFVPVLAGLYVGLIRIGKHEYLYEIQMFVGHAVRSALPVFALMIILYSLLWHAIRLRGGNS